MGVLDVATKLRDLSRDPANRQGIVSEQAMLPTLVVFLTNGDKNVKLLSLETLNFLSQEPANLSTMRKEDGLQEKVRTLMKSRTKRMSQLAASIMDNITNVSVEAWDEEEDEEPRTAHKSLSRRRKTVPTLPAKTFTFLLNDMRTQAQRGTLEEALLSRTGVVSFAIDVDQHKVIVRGRATEEDLQETIASTGLSVQPWKNAKKRARDDDDDYLSENEDPQPKGSGGWLGTLALWGTPAPAKKKSANGEFLVKYMLEKCQQNSQVWKQRLIALWREKK